MATRNDEKEVRAILEQANGGNTKFKQNNIDDCLSITQTTSWFNEPFIHIQFVETGSKTYLFYVNTDFFGLFSLKETEDVSWDNCTDTKTTVLSESSESEDGYYDYAVPNHNAQRVYVVLKQDENVTALYQYQPTTIQFDNGALKFSDKEKVVDLPTVVVTISCMSCFTLEGKDYVTLGASNRIILIDVDQGLTKTFDVENRLTVGDIVMTSDYYLYARVSNRTGTQLHTRKVNSNIYKFNLLEDEQDTVKKINIGRNKKEEYFGLVPYYTSTNRSEAPKTCIAGILRRQPFLDLQPYIAPFHKSAFEIYPDFKHTLGHPYVFLSVTDEMVYDESKCPLQKWDTLSKARQNNEQIRDNNFSVRTIQTIEHLDNARIVSARLNRTNTLVATLTNINVEKKQTLTVVDVRSRLSCTVETSMSEEYIVCYNFHPREHVLAIVYNQLMHLTPKSVLRRYNIVSTTMPVPEGTNIDAIKLEQWGEDKEIENTLCLGIEFIDYEMYFENEQEERLVRSKYDVAMYTLYFEPTKMKFGIRFVYEETSYTQSLAPLNATYPSWGPMARGEEGEDSDSERYISIAVSNTPTERSNIFEYIQSEGSCMWNCALRPDGKWIFLRPKVLSWIPLFSCCDIVSGKIVFLDNTLDRRSKLLKSVTIDNTVNDNIIITATDQETITNTNTYNIKKKERTAKYTTDYEGLAAYNRLIEHRHGDTMSMRAFTNRGGVSRRRIFLKAMHLIDARQNEDTIFCIEGMDAINEDNIVKSLDFTADDKHLFVCTPKRVFFVKILFKNHNIVPRDLYREEGMLKKGNFQMLSNTRMMSLEQNYLYTLEEEDKRKVNYDKINDADLRSGTNFSYRLPARYGRTLFASNDSGTICASGVQSKASDGPVYGLELIYLNQKQRIKAEEYR
jgi:hypothetical protein